MIVEKAAAFAEYAHTGQLDDNGQDYYKAHIVQVVNILRQVTTNQDILAAAYLHDIIEDTSVTAIDLAQQFGTKVAMLVWEVTHEGQKDSTGYSFPNLSSQEAIMIKFADRLSNISRMETWDQKRKDQYLKKSRFWRK